MPKQPSVNELINPLREYYFRRKHKTLFKQLAKKSHFSFYEIEALSLILKQIMTSMGSIHISNFRDIMHSTFDYTENKRHLLVDKVLGAMVDKFDSKISKAEWINGLSIMLNGSVDEKSVFAYTVYDWQRSNMLKKEQIFLIMKGCVIKQQPDENLDETVRDMIELIIKKFDANRDGNIDKEEFINVTNANHSYLECMGPVFPSRDARFAFLTTFSDKENAF